MNIIFSYSHLFTFSSTHFSSSLWSFNWQRRPDFVMAKIVLLWSGIKLVRNTSIIIICNFTISPLPKATSRKLFVLFSPSIADLPVRGTVPLLPMLPLLVFSTYQNLMWLQQFLSRVQEESLRKLINLTDYQQPQNNFRPTRYWWISRGKRSCWTPPWCCSSSPTHWPSCHAQRPPGRVLR